MRTKRMMKRNNLLETFTETEEKKYGFFPRVYIPKKIVIAMTILAAFAAVVNLYCMPLEEKKIQQLEKNGAGNTWNCPQCGNECYEWQISCLQCGYWRYGRH